MDVSKLKRRLARLIEQRDSILLKHKGKEEQFTYWGGWSLGYTLGKISEIENIIDELEEEKSISDT